MRRLRFICLFIFSTLLFVSVNSQNSDSLLRKAEFYMEIEEYGAAIPLLQKFSLEFPEEYHPYELAGDCYKEEMLFSEAVSSYLKAYSINYRKADILYKIGNIYDLNESIDSSIFYFEKYLNFEPNSVQGHIRLAIIFMNLPSGASDSCLYYSKRAVEIEPENHHAVNILAMSYFSLGNYTMSRDITVNALANDSNNTYLLNTCALSFFFLHDFNNAYKYFNHAVNISRDNILLRDYRALSYIMLNTDSNCIYYNNEGRIKFHNIYSENISDFEKELSKNKGKYNFRLLLKKFNENPSEFGLDQYFMLYYGSRNISDYSPNETIEEELNKLLDKDISKATEIAEKLIAEQPANFPLYYTLAGIYLQTGDFKKYSEYIQHYFGFLEAIKATGEIDDPKSPFIITHIDHKYEVALNFGVDIKDQKLIKEKKHYYNQLIGVDKKGKDMSLWFNIDKPYNRLIKTSPETKK